MNQFEMVVLIVAIVMIAGVLRAKYRSQRHGGAQLTRESQAEAAALRDEVRTLKERLAVIERITVEKENNLERQIEQLRDR